MGVRGLQTFMERSCSNVACEVNISDIVEAYRRETDREAIIVVDTMSCMRPLYKNLDWVCGGQIKEYVQIIKHFIEAFKNIGVKLVFFFDGPTQARKRRAWVERRMNNLQDVYKIFDAIEKGLKFNSNTVILPPALGYVFSHTINTFEECEIHRTVNECDEEIAEYAIQHNCFAILGQDSDYVIYDGPQYYLSAMHLNVEKMTTINYNRWALARQLHLSPSLLPLLASLVGNDLIRSDDLLYFHRRICDHHGQRSGYNRGERNNRRGQGSYHSWGNYNPQARPNPRDVFYNVASFIRDNTNETRLYEDIPMISRRVFGTEEKTSHLKSSVKSYCITPNPGSHQDKYNFDSQPPGTKMSWEQIQLFAEMRFRKGDLDSMVYAIMHDLPYESSTGLEDFRRQELPPSATVLQSLRQHIYGIILHDKLEDSTSYVVKEWCMRGEGSLDDALSVSTISPKPGLHPGLMALWNEKDTSDEMLSKKWKLLADAVSKDLDPEKLKCVPPTLLAPTLLLFFLTHEVSSPFLEPWEVDALIATAVVLSTYSESCLAALEIKHIIPRAVQLACIFLRGSSVIKMLIDACGRPIPQQQISISYYFDGKLFQNLYQKAKSGMKVINMCNNKVEQLEQFNLIHSIVCSN